MNNTEHNAFLFFSRNYPAGIALVFADLFHWGTIEWKGHKAGDWFYKSAKQTAEELGVGVMTAKRAYEIIGKGHCTIFESKVEKKGNYDITYLRVIHRNDNLSTIQQYQNGTEPVPKRDSYEYQNGTAITISTHNKLQEGDSPFVFTGEYFSKLLNHLFPSLTEGIELSLHPEQKVVNIWQSKGFARGKLNTLVSQHPAIIALKKEHGVFVDVVLNKGNL